MKAEFINVNKTLAAATADQYAEEERVDQPEGIKRKGKGKSKSKINTKSNTKSKSHEQEPDQQQE